MVRGDFYHKSEVYRGDSSWRYNITLPDKCIAFINTSTNEADITEKLKNASRSNASLILIEHGLKICHPNIESWWRDSSRLVYLGLISTGIIIWLCFLGQLGYENLKKPNKTNEEHSIFKKSLVLFTGFVMIIIMGIAFWSDVQNLKPNPARPLLDFDDGFRLIELVIIALATYFIIEAVDHMATLKMWKSHITEPCAWFQILSSLAAIVAIIRKTHLTNMYGGDFGGVEGEGPTVGLASIGITLVWLNIILKIGRYSFTIIGNFATMFHILLKKLRFYILTVFLLLFGFSFGFWVINQHSQFHNNITVFTTFSKSIKDAFV